jgi:hypothetical protein
VRAVIRLIRGLRRVVLLATSLAILLVLAAAGAASAADELDLVDTPPLAPVVTRLEPVKDRVVDSAKQALPDHSSKVARAILRRAKAAAESVSPAPIPRISVPDIPQRADRDDQPRLPRPLTPDQPQPSADPPSWLTASVAPQQPPSSSEDRAQQLDLSLLMRPLEAAAPLPLFAPADGAVIGGSGIGAGSWLGHGPPPPLRPGWRSTFALAITDALPRGLTPRPLVPPG